MRPSDQLAHAISYSISAIVYLLAAVHTLIWFRFRSSRTTNTKQSNYIRVAARTQLLLFTSGALTFGLAAQVFTDPLNEFANIRLLAHWCSLVWDAAAILVVAHWIQPQGLNRRLIWLVSLPFIVAAIGLGVLHVGSDRSDETANLVVYLGLSWSGTTYLGIFLVSIFIARLITLRVVLAGLIQEKNRNIRLALILIGCESLLFIVFVAARTGMQVAVINGYAVADIDWIPATIAGIANLILVLGYTYPDYPAYRHFYRIMRTQLTMYRSLYYLWADLTAHTLTTAKQTVPPSWWDVFAITNLSFRMSKRIADIDRLVNNITKATVIKPGDALLDTTALPTALEDLSINNPPTDDYLHQLGHIYSSRRQALRRPCLEELTSMAGTIR